MFNRCLERIGRSYEEMVENQADLSAAASISCFRRDNIWIALTFAIKAAGKDRVWEPYRKALKTHCYLVDPSAPGSLPRRVG
jgi:hypothetical protein